MSSGDVPESIKTNMEQGKGPDDTKGGFRIVGLSEEERKQHEEMQDAEVKRGRGRPPIDKNWRQVHPDAQSGA